MKKKGKGLFGFSSSRCCDFRTCTEIPGVCEPATMYDKAPKFEKKHGHDNSTCCLPKYCKKDLCANDTKWVDKGPHEESPEALGGRQRTSGKHR